MNTTFNIRRFWNYLCWDFIQNYRSYATLTLGVCIALIAIYFFNSRMEIVTTSFVSYDESSMTGTMQNSFVTGYNAGRNMMLDEFMMPADEPADADTPSPGVAEDLSQPSEPSMYTAWAVMVITIVVLLSGARVFKQMRRKEGAITFLMQPASRLEKFIGRTLTVLVISFVCCLLAVVLADIIFGLISLLLPGVSFSPVIVELFKASEPQDIHFGIISEIGKSRLTLFYYVFVATVFSTYIFGGTLFVRHPAVTTSVINCVVGIILITLAVNTLFVNMHAGYEGDINIRWITTVVTIILAAICVINFCLAYMFFCRKQIIN